MNYIITAICVVLLGIVQAPNRTNETQDPTTSQSIVWSDIESMEEAHKKDSRPVLIDVYTEWCGWCKVMDQKTFTDPKVIEFINENYYAVKLDAEDKKDIHFKGNEYTYVSSGKKGIHSLAYTLLDGNMSYPAFVLLDQELERAGYFKGYKQPDAFKEAILKTYGDS